MEMVSRYRRLDRHTIDIAVGLVIYMIHINGERLFMVPPTLR